MAAPAHVALIGFGEVGRIFAEGLRARGVQRLTAYDPLFARPDSKPSLAAAADFTPGEAELTSRK